jgi:hypothetical protein
LNVWPEARQPVWPGARELTSFCAVAKGRADEPSLASEPLVDAKSPHAEAALEFEGVRLARRPPANRNAVVDSAKNVRPWCL